MLHDQKLLDDNRAIELLLWRVSLIVVFLSSKRKPLLFLVGIILARLPSNMLGTLASLFSCSTGSLIVFVLDKIKAGWLPYNITAASVFQSQSLYHAFDQRRALLDDIWKAAGVRCQVVTHVHGNYHGNGRRRYGQFDSRCFAIWYGKREGTKQQTVYRITSCNLHR